MALDLLKAAVLGIIQGLTEFLPVSSTGHLILAEDLLDIDEDRYGLTFDAALHLGTLLALLVFFGGTWLRLIEGGLRAVRDRSFADPAGRLAWLLVLGTIPAAALGLAFEEPIEDAFRRPALVASTLIAFSAVFLLAEAAGRRQRRLDSAGWVDAVAVGFGQALALVPGVSRSGATICAGLFRDFDRAEAARFAFLLSAPIIVGAGLTKIAEFAADLAQGDVGGRELSFFLVGMACAAVVGYFAIGFLLRFLAANTLLPFVVYRVGLGLVVFAVLIVRAVA